MSDNGQKVSGLLSISQKAYQVSSWCVHKDLAIKEISLISATKVLNFDSCWAARAKFFVLPIVRHRYGRYWWPGGLARPWDLTRSQGTHTWPWGTRARPRRPRSRPRGPHTQSQWPRTRPRVPCVKPRVPRAAVAALCEAVGASRAAVAADLR